MRKYLPSLRRNNNAQNSTLQGNEEYHPHQVEEPVLQSWQQISQNLQETVQINRLNRNESYSSYDSGLQQSHMTAGGDGLEFIDGSESIFDEINRLVKGIAKQQPILESKQNHPVYNEGDPSVSNGLQASSILLESVKALETLRESLAPINDLQDELFGIVRQLSKKQPAIAKITTCSYTLNLLVNKLAQAYSEQDQMKGKLSSLQSQLFTTHTNLQRSHDQQRKLENNMDTLSQELSYYIEENKKLKTQIERVKEAKNEQAQCQVEEAQKYLVDNSNLKEKLHDARLVLKQNDNEIAELTQFKLSYDALIKDLDLKEEQTRLDQKRKDLQLIKYEGSLLGHISTQPSLFAEFTHNYLELKDIFKLYSLSKQTQRSLPSQIIMMRTYQELSEMSNEVCALKEVIQEQKRVIEKSEMREQVRRMMADHAEERLKHIVEKYVINKHRVGTGAEKAITESKQFLSQYITVATHIQKNSDKLNESQSSVGSQGSLEAVEIKPYKIVSAGKKIYGAFRGFGWRKGQQLTEQAIKDNEPMLEALQKNNEEEVQENADTTTEASIEQDHPAPPEEKTEKHMQKEEKEHQKDQKEEIIQVEEERKSDSLSQSSESSQHHVEQISILLDHAQNQEEMNELLFQIGKYLVHDKTHLSKWIAGLQNGYSQFFLQQRVLIDEIRELETLKDYFMMRYETLNLRLTDLLNQKEDLQARHDSDMQIKDHLVKKLSEVEKLAIEKQTELLYSKQTISEMTNEQNHKDQELNQVQAELSMIQDKVRTELTKVKERNAHLSDENSRIKKALDEMKQFFSSM